MPKLLLKGLHTRQEMEEYNSIHDSLHEAIENANTDDLSEIFMRYNFLIDSFHQRLRHEHFKAIAAQGSSAILESARDEIDGFIAEKLLRMEQSKQEQDKELLKQFFDENGVILSDDGEILLDSDYLREELRDVVDLHLYALEISDQQTVFDYIFTALRDNARIIKTKGDLSSEERGLLAHRPNWYKRPNAKLYNKIFTNALTGTEMQPVGLDEEKSVIIYANYTLPDTYKETGGLDAYDERVYSGVCSCRLAGNQFIPFSMIYSRGMLGLSPKTKSREISLSIENDIIDSILRCGGWIHKTNDPLNEHRDDPDFQIDEDYEPLLLCHITRKKVNGQWVRGIFLPDNYIPYGIRYSEINRNEIITDRIEAIHVEGLGYSRENIIVANVTYTRVKEMQYHDSEKDKRHRQDRREINYKERRMRYDYVAQAIFQRQNEEGERRAKRDGKDFKPKTYKDMTQTERSRLKKKIDLCMQSYQRNGLINHYQHIKGDDPKRPDDFKRFYAVEVFFEPEPEKLPSGDKTGKKAKKET